MNDHPKRLAAVFFISIEKGQARSLEDLLQGAGAANIAPVSDGTTMKYCDWAGWSGCRGALENLPYHQVLTIYFWQSLVFEQLEHDENMPHAGALPNLAQAFEAACSGLLPDAAFVLRFLWQVNSEFINGLEWKVLSKSANILIEEPFGAAYLDQGIAQHLSMPLTNREVHHLEQGRVIFAGEGARRWLW